MSTFDDLKSRYEQTLKFWKEHQNEFFLAMQRFRQEIFGHEWETVINLVDERYKRCELSIPNYAIHERNNPVSNAIVICQGQDKKCMHITAIKHNGLQTFEHKHWGNLPTKENLEKYPREAFDYLYPKSNVS